MIAMLSFRAMMAEVDRLEAVRWEAFLLLAKQEARPYRAMSPETSVRTASKLRGRVVHNKRLPAPAPTVDLDALD